MKRIAFIASAVASLTFAAASIAIFAQTPAAAPSTVGDAKAGAAHIQRCQGCHGIAGLRTAYPEVYKVPKIAGQHSTYFVSALKAYKSGDRKHAGMRAIAVSLSDKDMLDLAAYYAEAKK
jgi:cytochrome c553